MRAKGLWAAAAPSGGVCGCLHLQRGRQLLAPPHQDAHVLKIQLAQAHENLQLLGAHVQGPHLQQQTTLTSAWRILALCRRWGDTPYIPLYTDLQCAALSHRIQTSQSQSNDRTISRQSAKTAVPAEPTEVHNNVPVPSAVRWKIRSGNVTATDTFSCPTSHTSCACRHCT